MVLFASGGIVGDAVFPHILLEQSVALILCERIEQRLNDVDVIKKESMSDLLKVTESNVWDRRRIQGGGVRAFLSCFWRLKTREK